MLDGLRRYPWVVPRKGIFNVLAPSIQLADLTRRQRPESEDIGQIAGPALGIRDFRSLLRYTTHDAAGNPHPLRATSRRSTAGSPRRLTQPTSRRPGQC